MILARGQQLVKFILMDAIRHIIAMSYVAYLVLIYMYSPQQLLPSTCGRPVWGT